MSEETRRDITSADVSIALDDANGLPSLSYMSRMFLPLGLPYRHPGDIHVWSRTSRRRTLAVTTPLQETRMVQGRSVTVPAFPFGKYPRLTLRWICTEIKRPDRDDTTYLYPGGSYSDFLERLGALDRSGRTRIRLGDQTRRLLKSTFSYTDTSQGHEHGLQFTISDEFELWWSDRDPDQLPLMPSWIEVNRKFYDDVKSSAVPGKDSVVRKIVHDDQSGARLDIYQWLVWRMFVVTTQRQRPTLEPWDDLQLAFGNNYGERNADKFAKYFAQNLDQIRDEFYPEARLAVINEGVVLAPSPLHIDERTVPS